MSAELSTMNIPGNSLELQKKRAGIKHLEAFSFGWRRSATLLCIVAGMGLTGCAREPEPPRYAAAYPGQPVQSVVGTNYAAYPGLPAPPANNDGVTPPPPPRYIGESNEASSANVVRP